MKIQNYLTQKPTQIPKITPISRMLNYFYKKWKQIMYSQWQLENVFIIYYFLFSIISDNENLKPCKRVISIFVERYAPFKRWSSSFPVVIVLTQNQVCYLIFLFLQPHPSSILIYVVTF